MKSKDWYQTVELIGIDGMPNTVSGINYKARNENWLKRKAEGVKGRAYEYHLDSLPEATKSALTQAHTQLKKIDQLEMVKIPFFEVHASAGSGAVPMHDRESLYSIDIHPQILLNQGLPTSNLFTVTVKGDSMEPSLFDGDLVVLKRVQYPIFVLEGVYLLRIGNELFIKRIQFNKFETRLRVDSDNPFYDSYIITGEDLNHVEIFGEWVMTLSRARRVEYLKRHNASDELSLDS